MKGEGGFLILEILVAALILTASIAATMMIFRGGFQQLERADRSNGISAMLPQVLNVLQHKNLKIQEGEETLAPGIVLRWNASLENESRSGLYLQRLVRPIHKIFLYKVHVLLTNGELSREYDLHLFRADRGQSLPQELF